MSITEEYINKLWHIHTIGFYPAVKMNELPICHTAWMNIRNVKLNERSQAQKSTVLYDSTCVNYWNRQGSSMVVGSRISWLLLGEGGRGLLKGA